MNRSTIASGSDTEQDVAIRIPRPRDMSNHAMSHMSARDVQPTSGLYGN